jgi:hypothetical protein
MLGELIDHDNGLLAQFGLFFELSAEILVSALDRLHDDAAALSG